MKKIIFRVDSSTEIGSGHVMRCLTLAGRLKDECDITFICRVLDGNIGQLIKTHGFKLIYLQDVAADNALHGYEKWIKTIQEKDASQTIEAIGGCVDCLIVDNYALNTVWEDMLRPYAKKLMVIDDLADRRHSCDILLDQNYNFDLKTRYDDLVPDSCQKFLGPKYALLRDEFLLAAKKRKKRTGDIERILLFFGGSDKSNEMMKALKAITAIDHPFVTDAVVGVNSPYNSELEDFCAKCPDISFHCQVDNMAELMNMADICIGAGGAATWERCFMHLPSIVITVADNQVSGAKALADLGCINYLGTNDIVDAGNIKVSLEDYLLHPFKISDMSAACCDLFTGHNEAATMLKKALLD